MCLLGKTTHIYWDFIEFQSYLVNQTAYWLTIKIFSFPGNPLSWISSRVLEIQLNLLRVILLSDSANSVLTKSDRYNLQNMKKDRNYLQKILKKTVYIFSVCRIPPKKDLKSTMCDNKCRYGLGAFKTSFTFPLALKLS